MNLTERIISAKKPFVIAGPCSAESRGQMLNIAGNLDSNTISLLRAGIWKPRTRPNSFEGKGEEALPWLIEAGKISGIPTAVEVANKNHVELALKAGVDVLWVGARTTVNPFAVQEIADELEGTNIPVMVKNPVNPDLQLWLGAIERLEKAGISDLVAVHRGFSVYEHPKYRNVPSWEIPIALKEQRPDIPIICDPSHIGGKRELLLEISQKAMDLAFDGLMIETHPNPSEALSDKRQQVTSEGLLDVLNNLILRTVAFDKDVGSQIEDIREKVSTLDDRIFELLSARMQLSEEVGILKRENHITILQQEHWSKLIAARLKESSDFKLTKPFVRRFMDAVHQESIRHQTRVMKSKKIDDGK